jgi:hypothetical protein
LYHCTEATYGAMAAEHPLLQTRLGIVSAVQETATEDLPRLERLLRCESAEAHERMSKALWEAEGSVESAVAALEAIAGNGSLERWEAEAAEGGGDRRDDQGMGGGDAIRG